MFSNRYIFIYSIVLVVIVATVLSAASTVLKPFQEENVKIEKMSGVLASAKISSEKSVVLDMYNKYIVQELLVNVNGDIVSDYKNGELIKGDVRAFDIVLKDQLDSYKRYQDGDKKENPLFPIYICSKDGEKIFIVPLLGKGLWGPIWGNIALKKDFNTVIGATFDHKGETPGLGAEIGTKAFQQQFDGKKIFDEQKHFTSIKVVKGGVKNSKINPLHGVDAISGGTLTSNGVSKMLQDVLSVYEPFVKKHI